MIKKGFFVIFGIYILILIGIYFFQEKIIFRAKDLPKDHIYSFENKVEEITIKTDDNIALNALHFKVENSKGVILYFHGNKGNLERWGKKVQPLLNYGYDLLIMDYRGYGKNLGKRSEVIMYSDAELAYEYLLKSYDQEKIVVYGRSLGGTFATYVASRNHPKQLILEATFNNIIDVSQSLAPIFPFKKLFKFEFNSGQFIQNVKVPTTIFHGTDDSLVPIKLAEKLYNNSNKNLTEFLKINSGTHHNLNEFNEYNRKLKKLLE